MMLSKRNMGQKLTIAVEWNRYRYHLSFGGKVSICGVKVLSSYRPLSMWGISDNPIEFWCDRCDNGDNCYHLTPEEAVKYGAKLVEPSLISLANNRRILSAKYMGGPT